MKGKRVIAGILLAGILAVTMVGCKNTDNTKEETEKPVITLGSEMCIRDSPGIYTIEKCSVLTVKAMAHVCFMRKEAKHCMLHIVYTVRNGW